MVNLGNKSEMFRKPSAVFGQLLKNHEDFEFENQNSEVRP